MYVKLSKLGSIIMWEEEFWKENMKMDAEGIGGGWRTWTLTVILFIVTCRMLRFRFRSLFGGPSVSSSFSASTAPKTDALPSRRTPPIITDLDLKNLMDELDGDSPDVIWENVIDKSANLVSYKAKCCKPKDGPMKYLSVTTFEGCSAEVLLKFYMDNHYRVQWDKTVVHHQQLQVDHDCGIEIGRTVKKFTFLTPREYILAWKLWQGLDGSFYCFSKECEHPFAPKDKRCVSVAVFRSGWRIRKVPGRNASEIRIVHQEDAGLNVEMAKLAFAKGIWSYICKMDDALRKYSAQKQYSSAGDCISIHKVPPEFEGKNGMAGDTVHPENSIKVATGNNLRTRKSSMRRLCKKPSNKFITSSLVLLGGAICFSRGHSSLGAKVAMAYMLSKLTKRSTSSVQAAKLPCND